MTEETKIMAIAFAAARQLEPDLKTVFPSATRNQLVSHIATGITTGMVGLLEQLSTQLSGAMENDVSIEYKGPRAR